MHSAFSLWRRSSSGGRIFTPFKARLKNVESAEAISADELLFTLASPDPYAAACLDFPIIKTGTSAEDRKKAAAEL